MILSELVAGVSYDSFTIVFSVFRVLYAISWLGLEVYRGPPTVPWVTAMHHHSLLVTSVTATW